MIPSAAEQAIYDDDVRRLDERVAVGLDYPVWDGQRVDFFAGGPEPDPALWWFTEPAPDVSGGVVHFKNYGGPPFEMMISRPTWFPTNDPDLEIEATLSIKFPLLNPGYTIQAAIGTIQGGRAKLADPLRIVLLGSDATPGAGGSPGTIVVESAVRQATAGYRFTNDLASHTYKLLWKPNAPQPFETGNTKITVQVDGVTQIELTDPQEVRDAVQETNVVAPFFIVLGLVANYERNAQTASAAFATPALPVDIMQVEGITVIEAGSGYETREYPDWTTANAGGDLDTAELGERFSLDGETWAKLPALESWSITKGRDAQADTFSVQLAGTDADDPDAPNPFIGTQWKNRFLYRPLIVDTRIVSGISGSATAWKRQIAGIVEDVNVTDDGSRTFVTLTGRDRPSKKLDTNLSRSYLESAGASVSAVNVGYTIGDILSDIIDVADSAWANDSLGDTDKSIHGSPDMTPEALTAGGGNLLDAFTQIIDETGFQCFRRYAVTGTGRYGELVVSKWSLGLGASGLWQVKGDALLSDGYWEMPVGAFVPSAAFIRLGELPPGTFEHAFVQFDYPQLPQGCRLLNAYISMLADGAGGGVVFDGTIYFNDVDSAAFPTSSADANAKALTTGTAWLTTFNHLSGVNVKTPDIKAELQEVLDRTGYGQGNPLLAIIKTNSAPLGSVKFISLDGIGLKPTLIVEYDRGGRYVFRGGGSSFGPATIKNVSLGSSLRDGVGQVTISADNMLQTAAAFSGGEPGPGDFPRAPYPPAASEFHGSVSETGIFASLPLFHHLDENDHAHKGGVGKWRFRHENANKRVAELVVQGHDWIEPAEEIAIDDPDRTGLGVDETWVVDTLTVSSREGILETRAKLSANDYTRAITRAL